MILHCERYNLDRDIAASHILLLVYEQVQDDEKSKNNFKNLARKEGNVDLSYLNSNSNMTLTFGTSNPYIVQIN